MSSSPQRPIRIALIGAGIFVRDAHVPSLLRLADQFEVVAVYSRTQATASELAATIPYPVAVYTDVAELVSRGDVDALDVVLPIAVVPEVLGVALASGKHVVSEKPIAPDVKSGRELLALHAAQVGAPIWMVAENWRYEEAFLRAAEIVASGEIGDPLVCHWTIHAPVTPENKYYHTGWRRDGSFPGGFLLDGGVHHVAALRLILGEVASVVAYVDQKSAILRPADTMATSIRFESGALATYLVTYAAGTSWPSNLTITGTRGGLTVEREAVEVSRNGKIDRIPCAAFDGVEKELAAFAAAVRHGTPFRNTPAEGLRDVAVVEAMLLAAQTGRVQTPARVGD